MARTITTKSGFKPIEGTTQKMKVSDIVIDSEFNNRSNKPTSEEIQKLAVSIVDNGQVHPILCRSDNDKVLHVIVGFCRAEAVAIANEGFTTADGRFVHAPDLLIETRVVDIKNCDDKKAHIYNLTENGLRKNLSAPELARAVVKLTSEPFNLTQRQIAEAYGVQESRISRITKLLDLCPLGQELLESGRMAESVGIRFAELKDLTKQEEWINRALELAGEDNVSATYQNRANKEIDREAFKAQQESARELEQREAEAISHRQTSALPPHVLNDAEKDTETVTEASTKDTEGEPFDGGYPVSTPATTTEDTPKLTLTITPANGVMHKEEAKVTEPATVVAPTVRKRALTLGEIKELFSSLPDYNECLTAFSSITTAVLSGEMTIEEYSDQLVGLLAGEDE